MNCRRFRLAVLIGLLGLLWLSFEPSRGPGSIQAQAQIRGQWPDLTVRSIVLEPWDPQAGQIVQITAVILNQSRQDVEERFLVSFEVDGVVLARLILFDLPARQRRRLTVEWEAIEGTHLFKVGADVPEDRIRESDERNNTRTVEVVVPPRAGIQSFTQTALQAQARAWAQSAEALRFEVGAEMSDEDLLRLLEVLKEGFNTFAFAMNRAAGVLQSLRAQLPPAFAAESPLFSEALIAPYVSLGEAAALVGVSLGELYLDGVVEGMSRIEAAFRALAAQNGDGLDLTGLAQAADALAAAVEAALDLVDRFLDSRKGPLEEPLGALNEALSRLQAHLDRLGRALDEAAQAAPVRFLDAQGQPTSRYVAGAPLTLKLPVEAASGFTFELVGPDGRLVFEARSSSTALDWDGRDRWGRPLAAGTYFYRVRFVGSDGELWSRLGRLIASAP